MYNPEAILAGRPLRKTVDALVAGQVHPLQREYGRISNQANANVGQIDQLFKDLATSQAAASSRAAGISAGGNATQAGIATKQQQALEGAAQSADQMLGGASNPYTQGARAQLTQLVEQQKAGAAQTSAAQATASAQLGANSEQLLNAMGASNQMRGPELARDVLAKAAQDKNEIGGQIADIRGSGRAKILSSLISGERNYLGAAKTLGLNIAKQQEVVKQNKRTYKIAHQKLVDARRHNKITEQQLGERLQIERDNAQTRKERTYWQNKVDSWKLAHPNRKLGGSGKSGGGSSGGGAGSATPLQRKTNYNNFADVVAYVKRNPGAQKGDIGSPSGHDLWFKIANDPAYKKTGKIPRKYYADLHTRFPGILTKGK